MNFTQVSVGYTIVVIRLLPTSVFNHERVCFRFKNSTTSRNGSKRSNSSNFIDFRRTFLSVPIREDVRPNMDRLVFVIFMLNNSLLRPMCNFIVNIKNNSIIFMGDRSPFYFHFCLLMFYFDDVRLCLVINKIRFNRWLSLLCANTIFCVCFTSNSTCPRNGTSVLYNFCLSQGLRRHLFINEGGYICFCYLVAFNFPNALYTKA